MCEIFSYFFIFLYFFLFIHLFICLFVYLFYFFFDFLNFFNFFLLFVCLFSLLYHHSQSVVCDNMCALRQGHSLTGRLRKVTDSDNERLREVGLSSQWDQSLLNISIKPKIIGGILQMISN